MKSRLSKIIASSLVIALLAGILSSVVEGSSILRKKEQLMMEQLDKIMQGDTKDILYKEESVLEVDGIHSVTEDIFTEAYRIMITKTDQGDSAFVEDFATGMGYVIVDGKIIETHDLNEIRNTIKVWEMPEEDERLFNEYTKNRLEAGEKNGVMKPCPKN
jgi:hypothetical protein